MTNIAIIIRGHIRNSMTNNKLNELISQLVNLYNVDIYIHTWNKFEAKSSWRQLDNSNQLIVTNDIIINYFNEVKTHIKEIIIDDDEHIEIFGSTDGNVSNSFIPKIAWKRMWYGINKITQNVINSKINYDLLISTRFDNLDIQQSLSLNYGLIKICEMIEYFNSLNTKKIIFMENYICHGIDNFLMGPVNMLQQLHNKFHNSLDDIIISNSDVLCQEYLVFYEGQKINGDYDKKNNSNNKKSVHISKQLLNKKTKILMLRTLNQSTQNLK